MGPAIVVVLFVYRNLFYPINTPVKSADHWTLVPPNGDNKHHCKLDSARLELSLLTTCKCRKSINLTHWLEIDTLGYSLPFYHINTPVKSADYWAWFRLIATSKSSLQAWQRLLPSTAKVWNLTFELVSCCWRQFDVMCWRTFQSIISCSEWWRPLTSTWRLF